MRCHVWGTNNEIDRTTNGRGVACFAIPDWGLQFRAAQDGTALLCEYAALLALLRFVENNPKVFEDQRIEILSDSFQLVEQLAGRITVNPAELKPWTLIRAARDRMQFELTWVPTEQNQAKVGILDLPPLKSDFQISHAPTPRKPSGPRSQQFNG